MIFSCFYRKYAHKHKKKAANNSRIIFFALYLQCSPAQFLNLTIMETGVGFINLDDSVKIALNIALAVARENANECYTPSHLLKALLHKDVGLRDFIISIGKDLGYWRNGRTCISNNARNPPSCPKSSLRNGLTPFSVPQTMHESSSGCSTSIPSVCYWHMAKPGVAFSSDQLRSFPILEKDIHSIYIGNGQPACPSATTEKSYAPTSASSPLGQILCGSNRRCGQQAASGHQPRP